MHSPHFFGGSRAKAVACGEIWRIGRYSFAVALGYIHFLQIILSFIYSL
jgi:hypothetical protein